MYLHNAGQGTLSSQKATLLAQAHYAVSYNSCIGHIWYLLDLTYLCVIVTIGKNLVVEMLGFFSSASMSSTLNSDRGRPPKNYYSHSHIIYDKLQFPVVSLATPSN